MSDSPFKAPSLKTMNSLIPGFAFTSIVTSNSHGAVYFASQKSLDRLVAIKLLSPGSIGASEGKARFAAGLKHSNIISIYDSGIVEGMPYLVMEFVPGKSLAHSTRGMSVELGQAMVLIDGICKGLAHAHEHGIFHGHFDSSSVLLNQKAEPKIGNFGLLHSTKDDAADNTLKGYTAPEVVKDPAAATARSDIYSIAAVFYELLTGWRHKLDIGSPAEIAEFSPQVYAVLKQATDPDQAKRMADVHSFHEALKQAVEGRNTKLATIKKPQPRKSSMANRGVTNEATTKITTLNAVNVGFDWKIVRNLIIIAGLLVGISITLQRRAKLRAEQEQKNIEILALNAADLERANSDAAEIRSLALSELPVRPSTTLVTPQITGKTESPMESLERLHTRLRTGIRSEMPIGSVSKGHSDYFLVSNAMTWADAAWFAEDHGGHLAIPETEADPAWLSRVVSKDKVTWIGVARGGDSWVQADGSIWNSEKAPTGSGSHISLDNGRLVAADGSASKHPFIIQWHRDGSNPGKLDSLLATTKKSLSQAAPLFPPGTITMGSRHYLYVTRPVLWNEAKALAESSGGSLLVVSDEEEAANVKSMTLRIDRKSQIWLGGFLEGSLWVWVTGEPWEVPGWADDAKISNGNSALCMRPGSGWDSKNSEEEASGFIIEWSGDAKSIGAGKVMPDTAGDDTAALLARAKELVIAAKRKYHEANIANSKNLGWDLDTFIKSLSKSGQTQWEPQVDLIKSCVRDDRLEVKELKSKDISYTAEMLKLANYYTGKQIEIDSEFASSSEIIRNAFISKMSEIKTKEQASGQLKLTNDAANAIKAAADLDAWFESFSVQSASLD